MKCCFGCFVPRKYVRTDVVGVVCGVLRTMELDACCDRPVVPTEYGSATHILDRGNACNNLCHKDLSNCSTTPPQTILCRTNTNQHSISCSHCHSRCIRVLRNWEDDIILSPTTLVFPSASQNKITKLFTASWRNDSISYITYDKS